MGGMGKTTYSDIARAARVGTATVERVLNGRGGVRPETVARVITAARRLDWAGRLPARHRGILRIDVILVLPETAFFQRLARAFRRIAATLDKSVQIHITFMDDQAPLAIAERIARPDSHRAGLMIAAPAHPAVAGALRAVVANGEPVVQIVTRSVPEADYVGIDNLAVGRMAGMLMDRLLPQEGRVIGLCHGPAYLAHRERMAGFSDYMGRHTRAGLRFDFVAFGQDEDRMSATRVEEALRRYPDLVGIYNCGDGIRGMVEVLTKADRRILTIVHELNDLTRDALRRGLADVVFDQMPEAQARRATDLMLSRIGLLTEPVDMAPIRFSTETVETI